MNKSTRTRFSVAMAAQDDLILGEHLHKPGYQEDLAFAYWRPSVGKDRYTAVITELVLPEDAEHFLHGNVSFSHEYLLRVLESVPPGTGVAFIHGHPIPGWQSMSQDDVVAEQDRIAGPVYGRTGLPLVGLTRGSDGSWSGRTWGRIAPHTYERAPAESVRVVGRQLSITHHPSVRRIGYEPSQVRTVSVWGDNAQEQLVQARVGIVGLGSVGSLVAEALSRIGMRHLTYIDHDRIEEKNLDRTSGASRSDIGLLKVDIAHNAAARNSTSQSQDLLPVPASVLSEEGLAAALDCDVLFSCVDRPWPRSLLNTIAYSHLIPVVDGGIFAATKSDGTPLHIAWSIQTVGPGRACMECVGAYSRNEVGLDREGMLDDPDYIRGLSEAEKARYAGRNVYPFSMAVAAHEVLQFVGLVTGFERVGGTGPQRYDGYPGILKVCGPRECGEDCEINSMTATATDLRHNLDWRL